MIFSQFVVKEFVKRSQRTTSNGLTIFELSRNFTNFHKNQTGCFSNSTLSNSFMRNCDYKDTQSKCNALNPNLVAYFSNESDSDDKKKYNRFEDLNTEALINELKKMQKDIEDGNSNADDENVRDDINNLRKRLKDAGVKFDEKLPELPDELKEEKEESKVSREVAEEEDDDDDDAGETMEFQAETRKLLDIVTHSLYTDKQVFLRELVSNGSDALEKLRHLQSNTKEGTAISDSSVPLELRIETDEQKGLLTITDTGIGMTKDEMISNLGTIARSGSKAFVEKLSQMRAQQQESDNEALDLEASERGIIGQFGVGFYSAFMVGEKVEVRSKPAMASGDDEEAYVWKSAGTGSYSISPLSSNIRQDRGTSIVIHLKNDVLEYVKEKNIETIVKKYSNFINFPIYLNGNRVNTIQAIWASDPKQVSKEAYNEFYKFIANDARNDPIYTLHFRADAPVDIKALFYVPDHHTEKFGMGRMENGINLYSRKVLIESKSKDIVPEWLRFLKGAVDSEDLPLSISREKPQDSALISKLKAVLTRKFLTFLANKAKKDPADYKENFFREYGMFLKEGVCQDYEFQQQLTKLLYFETSKTMNKELSSLDEYISRCPPEQKEIYFLCTASREIGFQSPYFEQFEKNSREVIFVYSAIDDFVMNNIAEYEGRKIVSIESGNINLDTKSDDKQDDETSKDSDEEEKREDEVALKLTEIQVLDFCDWFKNLMPDKIESCKPTTRLSSSPAIVTNHQSGAMRRMMRMVDSQDVNFSVEPLPKLEVEINPDHEIIQRMYALREKEPLLAKVCAEQVYDNCLVAAGIMDDSRVMLNRLNDLLVSVVKGAMVIQDYQSKEGEGKVEKGEENAKEVIEGEIFDSEGKIPPPKLEGDVQEAEIKEKETKETTK